MTFESIIELAGKLLIVMVIVLLARAVKKSERTKWAEQSRNEIALKDNSGQHSALKNNRNTQKCLGLPYSATQERNFRDKNSIGDRELTSNEMANFLKITARASVLPDDILIELSNALCNPLDLIACIDYLDVIPMLNSGHQLFCCRSVDELANLGTICCVIAYRDMGTSLKIDAITYWGSKINEQADTVLCIIPISLVTEEKEWYIAATMKR
jgi:hypothetical protein